MKAPREIGLAIRKARIASGMTQKRLALRVGMPQSAFSRIESGDRRCTLLELVDIAEALNVHPDQLFRDVLKALKP